MASSEISQSHVIQLIEQYLLENGFSEAYAALASSSRVALADGVVCANLAAAAPAAGDVSATSAASSSKDASNNALAGLVEQLISAVAKGQWDRVLAIATRQLVVPDARMLTDVFEHMLLELIEMREVDTAQMLLEHTAPLSVLRQADAARHARLARLVASPAPTQDELFGGAAKEDRRARIVAELRRRMRAAEPGRLLAVISAAMQGGRQFASVQDLLPRTLTATGAAAQDTSDDDSQCVKDCVCTIKFGKNSFAEAAAFSPNGKWLVCGSHDGFVELYDWKTGKLDVSLEYQAKDAILLHEHAVLAVCFSADSKMVASGDGAGCIKVWHAERGACLRSFSRAHTGGVSSLHFNQDGSQLLSASHDGTVKLFGLQAEACLKTFQGGASFCTSARFSADESRIITSNKDGFVRIFNAKTMECISQFVPSEHALQVPASSGGAGKLAAQQAAASRSVHSVHLLPPANDTILVCTDSPTIWLAKLDGTVVGSVQASAAAKLADVECAAPTHAGRFIYACTQDGMMHAIDQGKGTVSQTYRDIHRKMTLGVVAHPSRNVIATWSADGRVKVWQ